MKVRQCTYQNHREFEFFCVCNLFISVITYCGQSEAGSVQEKNWYSILADKLTYLLKYFFFKRTVTVLF